jgi:hypothetical protein
MAFAVKASFSHSSHSVLCRRSAMFVVDLTSRTSRTIPKEQMCVTSLFPSARQLSRGFDHITKSAFTGNLESNLPLQFNCIVFHKSFELPTDCQFLSRPGASGVFF